MVKPRDREKAAIEDIVCHSQFLRESMRASPGGGWAEGEAPGSVRMRKEQGKKVGKRLRDSFWEKERVKQGERV